MKNNNCRAAKIYTRLRSLAPRVIAAHAITVPMNIQYDNIIIINNGFVIIYSIRIVQ